MLLKERSSNVGSKAKADVAISINNWWGLWGTLVRIIVYKYVSVVPTLRSADRNVTSWILSVYYTDITRSLDPAVQC